MENVVIFGLSKGAFMALLTGICAAVALALFVRDVLYRSARPYLWAWLVRAVLAVVALVSQFAGGATYSLALSGAQVLSVGVIIAVIVKYQARMGSLDGVDRFALVLAAVGVSIWTISGNPLYGLLGSLFAEAIATLLAVRANLMKGTEDSVAFWACWLAAGFAAGLAANSTSAVVLAAPLFSIANATVNIGVVVWGRRRNRNLSLAVEMSAPADPNYSD